MIDREARSKTAESLRALAGGLITNDEYDDRFLRSEDPAIRAVSDGGWSLYSDFRCYKLRGKYKLSKSTKSEIARWVLFLQTDLEYEWKDSKGIRYFHLAFILLFILGNFIIGSKYLLLMWFLYMFFEWFIWKNLIMKPYLSAYRKQGDFELWPFIRRSDYQLALNHPVYLVGGPRAV